jgi:hypothetical protein
MPDKKEIREPSLLEYSIVIFITFIVAFIMTVTGREFAPLSDENDENKDVVE